MPELTQGPDPHPKKPKLTVPPGASDTLCVPKTLSALINRRNRLTLEDNVRPVLFHPGRLGVTIQVETPA